MLFLLTCVACRNIRSEQSLAEQRERQYALNSQLLNEGLGQIVSEDSVLCVADEYLAKYYADTTRQRIWTAELLPTQKADAMVAALESALPRTGFSVESFSLPQIREDLDSTRNLSTDSITPRHIERLARIEYLLTKAYLRYVVGQSYGFMSHVKRKFNHLDVRDMGADGRALTYREIMHMDISDPSDDFMAKAFEEARRGEGVSFLQSCEPASDIYKMLEARLAGTVDTSFREKLMANMERLRWKHDNQPRKDEKHVLVNIAAQRLWAVSKDTLFSMNVVCGARKTKTPLMKGMLNWLVVNPEWYIPANIVRNEISAHGGDSNYFARHRYFITDSNRDTIPAASVSRQQLARNLYRVTQRRGPGNSLGRLKFNFSNPFDIYLHDTNMPSAFNYANRTLSHGCVRVQNPFDLACFLLDLKDEDVQDRLRIAIGKKPKGKKEAKWLEENAEDQEKQMARFGNRGINPNVPVYITYYSVYPDPENGQLQTWNDPYGYDVQVLKAIKPFM